VDPPSIKSTPRGFPLMIFSMTYLQAFSLIARLDRIFWLTVELPSSENVTKIKLYYLYILSNIYYSATVQHVGIHSW
jgi:hypothetical protein